jgi:pimeloyl-ACP methyl ester carboxylesterase
MSAQRFSTARRALLFAAIVLGVGFAWTRFLVAEIEHEFPPSGSFVEVDGLRVHYVESGTGVPIVLLHGVYGGVEDWRASIFDAAAARGRAIAIDRPGHGYSERASETPRTPAGQARFVHAVLKKLGIERAFVVGFSWSGGVATSYALQFPDETAGVMTINGALYEWESISSATDAVMGIPLVGPLFAHTLAMPCALALRDGGARRAFRPALISPRFERSALSLELRPENLLSNALEMRTLKAALRAQSPHYGEIKVPLSIVTGLGDEVTFATFHSFRLHDAVAGSKLVTVDGAGHQVIFSHPDAVLGALDDLLSRVEGESGRARRH